MEYATKVWSIASAAQTSDAINVEDYKVFAIKFPTMTGATITFQGCETLAGTYVDVYDQDGTQISITATDNSIVGLDAAALELAAIPFVKIVSASAEASARTVLLMCKK